MLIIRRLLSTYIFISFLVNISLVIVSVAKNHELSQWWQLLNVVDAPLFRFGILSTPLAICVQIGVSWFAQRNDARRRDLTTALKEFPFYIALLIILASVLTLLQSAIWDIVAHASVNPVLQTLSNGERRPFALFWSVQISAAWLLSFVYHSWASVDSLSDSTTTSATTTTSNKAEIAAPHSPHSPVMLSFSANSLTSPYRRVSSGSQHSVKSTTSTASPLQPLNVPEALPSAHTVPAFRRASTGSLTLHRASICSQGSVGSQRSDSSIPLLPEMRAPRSRRRLSSKESVTSIRSIDRENSTGSSGGTMSESSSVRVEVTSEELCSTALPTVRTPRLVVTFPSAEVMPHVTIRVREEVYEHVTTNYIPALKILCAEMQHAHRSQDSARLCEFATKICAQADGYGLEHIVEYCRRVLSLSAQQSASKQLGECLHEFEMTLLTAKVVPIGL
eukprot:TRINITY_DN14304_c0_g1_i1.p1 TRINITY_DN14304_c0_g1~~TRINITY_DN14304_c0_g1_i1.p1  ORF type:complete len:449 (+),score=51.61 TRINITY_DN14304_c0_g1_i1:95-1441(+)